MGFDALSPLERLVQQSLGIISKTLLGCHASNISPILLAAIELPETFPERSKTSLALS